jgi:hypothetical protein
MSLRYEESKSLQHFPASLLPDIMAASTLEQRARFIASPPAVASRGRTHSARAEEGSSRGHLSDASYREPWVRCHLALTPRPFSLGERGDRFVIPGPLSPEGERVAPQGGAG